MPKHDNPRTPRAGQIAAHVLGDNDPLPPHRRPSACYVCGGTEDGHSTTAHTYWSNADAAAEFAAADARIAPVYSDGSTTPEARYVAEYRPY